jgi:lyso-ornithine lipid O-acyltransferase
MNAQPRRLKAKRAPPLRKAPDRTDGAWPIVPSRIGLARRLRAVRRLLAVAIWTMVSIVVQSVLVPLPGHPRVWFARVYWAVMCRLIGLRVRVIGVPVRASGGRPVVFVSNHSSWLDILVLGGRLEAAFIAKGEVARWPVIATIARLGRTVYVRRTRASTMTERDEMGRRLESGGNLVLFPEGTTSDGSRVLPFRSAFLSVAELKVTPEGATPIVQPVSVVYDRLGYLPTGRAARPLFAWYGDMDIGSHFWRLAQHRGLRATVLLHAPIDPAACPSRKALAQTAWRAVADGASTLRQNRPASPLAGPRPQNGEASAPACA